MDEDFFNKYKKAQKKEKGIPNFEMNRPFRKNTYKGTIGLELEIEGDGLPNEGYLDGVVGGKSGARWTAARDGSLRGENLEYKFTKPCTVEELPVMVNGLFDTFRKHETNLRNSNRCSTHVHINMGNHKVNQITSMLAFWMSFEEAFVRWCGEERKTNHYCLTSSDCGTTVHLWNDFLKTGVLNYTEENAKYVSQNALTLWTFGSLEYRCAPAAESPEMPIKWATFLHYFTDYVCNRYLNPMNIAYDLSERGALAIFREICEQHPLCEEFRNEVLLLCPDFDALAMKGFRNAQPFVMGHPWNEWIELINKEYVPDPFKKKAIKAKMPRAIHRNEAAGFNHWIGNRVEEIAIQHVNEAVPLDVAGARFNEILFDEERRLERELRDRELRDIDDGL